MPNLKLQNAIRSAGLSPEEFADIVQVDVKIVQRWIAGRASYPRHRSRAADALDTTEHALWPDTVPPPTTASEQAHAFQVVATDDLSGYGRATDAGAPRPLDVLRAAVDAIEVVIAADSTDSSLVDVLRERAADGCGVRVIVENLDDQIEDLLGCDGIEVRASPGGENRIYRADDQLLLVLISIGGSSEAPPVLCVSRVTDGGLFDRIADDFDDRWQQATPITSREQLRAYLVNAPLQPATEPEQLRVTKQPASPAVPLAETPGPLSPDAPRRWPRRAG